MAASWCLTLVGPAAEDFATFCNNDSAEAKVGNFQHLAPVLRALNIK